MLFLFGYRLVCFGLCCKCHVFVHVCFCKRPCLACLSVILRHRWGSSQPVSFIIPSNYSKNSFQSSCSSRSSLSPSIQPRIHPSIKLMLSLSLSFSHLSVPKSPLHLLPPLPLWDRCLWWRELNQQLSLSNNMSCVIRLHCMIRVFWINNLTIIGHIFSARHVWYVVSVVGGTCMYVWCNSVYLSTAKSMLRKHSYFTRWWFQINFYEVICTKQFNFFFK